MARMAHTKVIGFAVYSLVEYQIEPRIAEVENRLFDLELENDDTGLETIQIVIDKRLLHATDQSALRTKRNRSALVRDALREHLRRLEVRAKEERDRRGYFRAAARVR